MANAYITEAFKRLNMLDEDVFDVTDDGIQELKDFEDDSETDETVDIIDPEAENEDELEDSYVGKVILDCCVCHSKIYKNKEEVHLSDNETIANEDEECPYCYSTDGFKVIGEVAAFSNEDEKGEEEKAEDDSENDDGNIEVEVKDEEEVVEESVKKPMREAHEADPKFVSMVNRFLRSAISDDYSGKIADAIADYVKDDIETAADADWNEDDLRLAIGRALIHHLNLEESVKKTRKGKALKESFKRRNLKESWGDVYEDLVDRAKSWIDDGYDLDDAVNRALDDGLIYTSDIMELGSHYGVIDDSQIISDMYEDLYSDIYGEVSDYYDEAHENDDEDVDESLKKKSCKGGKCKELKEGRKIDIYKNGEYAYSTNKFKRIKDAVDDARKSGKVKVASIPNKDIDFTDKDKVTGKFGEGKKVKEDLNEVTVTTDDTHMEMTSDEDGKVTVTTEPVENAETVVAPIEDETKVEIENNNDEDDEDEVEGEDEIEMDIDDFSTDEFDELGESFLKKSYNNVESFKTTGATVKDSTLKVEGLITFKSGAKKKTAFVFESKDMSKRGKFRLIGENLQLSRGHKSFTVIGTITDKKFVSESLNYNYRASDANGKSQRVYGTVRVSKK